MRLSFLTFFFFLFAFSSVPGVFGGTAFAAPGQRKLTEKEEAELREVGDGFEAMMVRQMYQQMKATSETWSEGNDMFKPSNAERIFRSMQEEEMIKGLARRRTLGVGNLVEREARKMVK